MAHRGRLNVLANTLNKTYESIFSEFEGKDYDDALVEGDVKYHGLQQPGGHQREEGGAAHPEPQPQPPGERHARDAGIARAIIEHDHAFEAKKVVPIVIHGDAAIAGQGVVYEVVQMAKHKAYSTGGTCTWW